MCKPVYYALHEDECTALMSYKFWFNAKKRNKISGRNPIPKKLPYAYWLRLHDDFWDRQFYCKYSHSCIIFQYKYILFGALSFICINSTLKCLIPSNTNMA